MPTSSLSLLLLINSVGWQPRAPLPNISSNKARQPTPYALQRLLPAESKALHTRRLERPSKPAMAQHLGAQLLGVDMSGPPGGARADKLAAVTVLAAAHQVQVSVQASTHIMIPLYHRKTLSKHPGCASMHVTLSDLDSCHSHANGMS